MMSVVTFNVMGSSENTYDKDTRWWSTPYEYTNCFFTGYAHVNLSGVGCPELGSLLLMPTTGELNVDYKEYGSKYKDEQASPGYYSNYLTKYNVKTEVSATPRSGIARFTFPKGKSHLLLFLFRSEYKVYTFPDPYPIQPQHPSSDVVSSNTLLQKDSS